MSIKDFFALFNRAFVITDTECRVFAVASYSFAAFSVATVIQILTSGGVDEQMQKHLAQVAMCIMPLVATGFGLDFYCIGKPNTRWLSHALLMVSGAMMAFTAVSLNKALGIYSPLVAEFLNYGMIAAFILLGFAWLASMVLTKPATEQT